MSRPHRLLAALVPPPRDQWIRAHAAELVHIEGRRARTKWQLGVVPLFGWALASQLLQQPRSFLGSTLTRGIAGGLSFVNLIAGVALVGIYLTSTQPLNMLGLGLVLIVQATSRAYLPARARCTKAGAAHFTCPRRQHTCCRDRARCVLGRRRHQHRRDRRRSRVRPHDGRPAHRRTRGRLPARLHSTTTQPAPDQLPNVLAEARSLDSATGSCHGYVVLVVESSREERTPQHAF